jgi:hypothetical protein
VNLLKAEVDLKVTDAEIAEITDFLDLVPAVEVTKKSDNEVVITKEQFDSMQSNLQKLQDSQHRSEVRKWVEDECPNLNMSIGDAVDAIVKAETAGETVAKSLKDSFKSTSDALKNNTIFKEFGRSGDASGAVPDDTLGNGIVSEIKKNVAEISKSDSKSSSHEVVLDSIRKAAGSDGVRFMQYRDQHVRRAKLA